MSEQKLTPFCSGDFVKLAVNDHIRVENYVTNEHSQMGIIDVFSYDGQFIGGQIHPHSQTRSPFLLCGPSLLVLRPRLLPYLVPKSLDPQFAQAYNNSGNTYNDLGEYQRAIKDLNEAIRSLSSKERIPKSESFC